jgi:transposase, IS6 family
MQHRPDHERPVEVVTDKAVPLLAAVDDVLPEALPNTDRFANNRIEADHGRLKARLRPMRHLHCDRTAAVMIRGHAFVQNLRRGHYELGVDAPSRHLRLAAAFDELANMI